MQKIVIENRKIYNSSEKMVATPRIDQGFFGFIQAPPEGKATGPRALQELVRS